MLRLVGDSFTTLRGRSTSRHHLAIIRHIIKGRFRSSRKALFGNFEYNRKRSQTNADNGTRRKSELDANLVLVFRVLHELQNHGRKVRLSQYKKLISASLAVNSSETKMRGRSSQWLSIRSQAPLIIVLKADFELSNLDTAARIRFMALISVDTSVRTGPLLASHRNVLMIRTKSAGLGGGKICARHKL
jgi:hypothetical protein